MSNQENSFVGFEYMEVPAKRSMESMYVDSYRSFGWVFEGPLAREDSGDTVKLRFKRERRLRGQAELTRLQRNFDSCIAELRALERSKTTRAAAAALTAGVLGTAFMAGSTFAAVSTPPNLWLMILLAVPGFLGWILPYFLYRAMVRRKTVQIEPLIEQTYDEINDICQKGSRLLP